MHSIRSKISVSILIVLAALVISQPSSATTLSLDVTTLKGVTQIGTVTTAQVGNEVKVTITLDPGYLLPTHDSYVMFNTTGGLKLTNTSLDGFSPSTETSSLSTAPEPGTLALLGTGLVGLATVVRRRSGGKEKVRIVIIRLADLGRSSASLTRLYC